MMAVISASGVVSSATTSKAILINGPEQVDSLGLK
jgi:hypothetical protein